MTLEYGIGMVEFGLIKNDEEAYKWYKQAADLKDTRGMAMAGMHLATGAGSRKEYWSWHGVDHVSCREGV